MQEFSGGLDLINRLKPVAFKWKEGGERDFGLNAEDVAEVEPLLVTRNAKGEVEEVTHDNLMVVFQRLQTTAGADQKLAPRDRNTDETTAAA